MADQSAISGTAITYSAGYTYITFSTTITGLSTYLTHRAHWLHRADDLPLFLSIHFFVPSPRHSKILCLSLSRRPHGLVCVCVLLLLMLLLLGFLL